MHEHLNWLTVLLNKWFGHLALAVLSAVHVTPRDSAYPIPNFVAASVLVVLISMLFFLWLRPRISVDRPGGTQQVMEMLLTNPMGIGIRDLLDENIDHGARDERRHRLSATAVLGYGGNRQLRGKALL